MQFLRVHAVAIVGEGQADVLVDDGFVDPDLLGADVGVVRVIWGKRKHQGRPGNKHQLSENTAGNKSESEDGRAASSPGEHHPNQYKSPQIINDNNTEQLPGEEKTKPSQGSSFISCLQSSWCSARTERSCKNASDSTFCLQDVTESNRSETETRAPQSQPQLPHSIFFHLFPWDLGGEEGWDVMAPLPHCLFSAASAERQRTAQANKRNHSWAGFFLETLNPNCNTV